MRSVCWETLVLVSSKQNHQTVKEPVLQRYQVFLLLYREWFFLGSLSSVETQPKKG